MAHRISKRLVMLAGAAIANLGLGSTAAHAGGFFLHEQSSYFQGTSWAGVAAGGPALSAMFWNPATITQHGLGLTSETNVFAVFPKSDINPIAATAGNGANLLGFGSSGDIGKDAFVAASYYVYGLTDRISLGVALNSPFGLRTEPNPMWAGMFHSRESEVFSLNFNPNIGFKVTDWLSVGAGVQVEYLRAKLYSAFPGSGTLPPLGFAPDSLRLDADSWDFGWTAGLTITPTPWTTIGVGYRSRIDHSLEGDIYRPGFIQPVGAGILSFPFAFVNFTIEAPLPDIATASIRQKVTEAFTLMATVEWQNWSRLNTIPVAAFPFGLPGIPTTLPFEWDDGWLFSVGAEYQWLPNLAVRAGIGWEQSPISDEVRGTRLPDSDRLWVSAGATYKWNQQLSIDVAYTHVFYQDAPINIVPGHPLFNPALGTFIGDAESQADILSVALRYRWAPPPPPVVVKGKG